MEAKKVEVEGGELLIKSSNGLMAIIPKDKASWVQEQIKTRNFSAVDDFVKNLKQLERMPEGKRIAEDGLYASSNPDGDGTPFMNVVASYKKSMANPSYKARLAREMFGDATPNQEAVEREYKKRADILDNMKVIDASKDMDKSMDMTAMGVLGAYDDKTNSILYNPAIIDKDSDIEAVMAHEAAHGLDTNRDDFLNFTRSPFTKKKEEIVGDKPNEFYDKNTAKLNLSTNYSAIINNLKNDIKSGKIKVTGNKQELEEVLSKWPSAGSSFATSLEDVFDAVNNNTNITPDYINKLSNTPATKQVMTERVVDKKYGDLLYLNHDTEVKARINALRTKANLKYGYDYNEPFDISKYPELKKDINYKQLSEDLEMPDEKISQLSEYVAYEPTGMEKEIAKNGLYFNINAKRNRIAAGSGERMRKPGEKGAPTSQQFKDAAKTAKAEDGMILGYTNPMADNYGAVARINYLISQRNAAKAKQNDNGEGR